MEQELVFNTGLSNNDIEHLTQIEFNKWTMNRRVLSINGVWLRSTDREVYLSIDEVADLQSKVYKLKNSEVKRRL